MTVYARSDVMSVALSEAHGGCGASHTRPVTHGAPAKLWALDCPRCETHLRTDPHWAVMPSDIPETPDEISIREDVEKRGARDAQEQMQSAILSLAQSHEKLPAQLVDAFAAVGAYLGGQTGSATCPAGHAQAESAKFCGECGAPMGTAPNAEATTDMVPAELVKKTLPELRALATALGVPVSGSKADLIARLAG